MQFRMENDSCRGAVMHAVGVVDEYATGFYFVFKLVETLLIEYYRHVIAVKFGLRDIVPMDAVLRGLKKTLPERHHHLMPLNEEAMVLLCVQTCRDSAD